MEKVFNKAQSYKYNSVMYKDLEDIGDIHEENIVEIADAVFIIKETFKEVIIYWGAQTKESFFHGFNKVINIISNKNIKQNRLFIEFIPEDFIEGMEDLGFRVVSEWTDYWVDNLQSIKVPASPFESVRLLNADEFHSAAKVLQSCEGYSREFTGESDEWVKEWNEDENSCVLVAEENSEIIGVCCLNIYGFYSEKGPVLWLREIGVMPRWQGKGIGYALINKAFKWGEEHGAKRSFLACDIENCNGIRLYEKFGYRKKEGRGQINMAKENK
ncbi:GNAT family N-acetyltransferase [Clostridium sp. MSJ-4]|uniref:GNAT family N-acetyltransferase n=1 Tax=Clostridium simiarum TaxID=2841506 RepID=A0ABS6F6P7_9CLOT|nr:GNAT family N-acetyltransferase [Clostridium simiarum]